MYCVLCTLQNAVFFVQLFCKMWLVFVDHLILPWIACAYFWDIFEIFTPKEMFLYKEMRPFLHYSSLIWLVLLHSFCWFDEDWLRTGVWWKNGIDDETCPYQPKGKGKEKEKVYYVNLTRIGSGQRSQGQMIHWCNQILSDGPPARVPLPMTIRK